MQWLRLTIDCRVSPVMNGARLSMSQAKKAKREGMEAGTPDLFVIFADGPEPRVLFIECKTETGRLSKEQKAWRDDCKRYGHDYIVARSLDDVKAWFGGE